MSEWLDSENRPYGLVTNGEGQFYKRVVEKYHKGVLVEIGCYIGKSLSYVLPSCRELGIQVYAVDIWNGGTSRPNDPPFNVEIFKRNLKRMNALESTHIIHCDSVKAAEQFQDESVDVIMLDSSHTLKNTTLEIKAWWPKLKKNGSMLFHDYGVQADWAQVKPAVDQLLGAPTELVESLAMVTKT